MVWRVVAENDPREKDLHVGVTRGSSPGDVTTIVATRGKVLSHFQEPQSAVFAGSDDGFIAQYDDRLNFIKDWHAQAWLHGLQQFFHFYFEFFQNICLNNIQPCWAGARGDQPGGGEGRGRHHLALLGLSIRGDQAVVAGSPGAHLSEHS